jgi:hypothetical protein
MKKIILGLLLVMIMPSAIFAQSPKPASSPAPTPKDSVDYVLPYPGILPDNVLYKVKMFRDKVEAMFITDNLRKAEFFLKMGDKRINASKFLTDYGKFDLASTTASKAEIYLLRSVEEAEKVKNKGKDVKSFLGRLTTAALKHEELLTDMWGKAPDGPKQSFEKSKIITGDVIKKAQEL